MVSTSLCVINLEMWINHPIHTNNIPIIPFSLNFQGMGFWELVILSVIPIKAAEGLAPSLSWKKQNKTGSMCCGVASHCLQQNYHVSQGRARMGESVLWFWTDLEWNSCFTDDWSCEPGQSLGGLAFSLAREKQQHLLERVVVRNKIL